MILLSGESVWTVPNVLLFYLGSLSPLLGGIVMIRRSEGTAGRRRLGDRIANPRRIRPRWYVVIVLLYPGLTVVAGGLAVLTGATTQPFDPASTVRRLTNPLSLVAFFGFTVVRDWSRRPVRPATSSTG